MKENKIKVALECIAKLLELREKLETVMNEDQENESGELTADDIEFDFEGMDDYSAAAYKELETIGKWKYTGDNKKRILPYPKHPNRELQEQFNLFWDVKHYYKHVGVK